MILVDFREYQENLIDGLYSGQPLRSHVWLCPAGDLWEVANFVAPRQLPRASSRWQDSVGDRATWRRSQSATCSQCLAAL